MFIKKYFRNLQVVEVREAVCFLSKRNHNSRLFKTIKLDQQMHILNPMPEDCNDAAIKWDREFLYRRLNGKGKLDEFSSEEVGLCNLITEYLASNITSLLFDREPFDAVCNLSFPLLKTSVDIGPYSHSFKGIKFSSLLDNRILLLHSSSLAHELIFLNALPSAYFFHPYGEQGQNCLSYCSDKKGKRDLIIRTLAHFLFSSENYSIKWNQKEVAEHYIMKAFGLTAGFSQNGDFRVIRDLVRELIPEKCRKVGNPNHLHYSHEELSVKPNPIPGIFYKDNEGNVKADYMALRIVGRSLSLGYFLNKREVFKGALNTHYEEIKCLPTFKWIMENLDAMNQVVFSFEVDEFLSILSNVRIRYFP